MEVAYLLVHGTLPTPEEKENFSKGIKGIDLFTAARDRHCNIRG